MPFDKYFISILIPTWNRARHLEAQINSLISYLSHDIELLISDNASDDDTQAVVLKIKSCHPDLEIVYVRNSINAGADANYQKSLIHGRGQWLWLIGDDDPINFSLIPRLREILSTTSQQVILLQPSEANEAIASRPLTCEEFLLRRNDRLGSDLLQIGCVICRKQLISEFAQWEHYKGLLHIYLPCYSAGILRGGLTLVRCFLFLKNRAQVLPRWNLLQGHFGAWQSNLLAFPSFRREIQARERRIREGDIIIIILADLLCKRYLTKEHISKVLILFSIKGVFSILLLYLSAMFGSRTAGLIARVVFSKKMRRAIALNQLRARSLN